VRYERVKGTVDIFGQDIPYWYFVEQRAIQVALLFGYTEIRTPVFEQTELFARSVGQETDIVQKEMYTFTDKGGRSITLRPEGTAPTIRAFLENSMINLGLPQRFYYLGPMFRYERPQAGRLRQFHQFGIELIGSADPAADVETIQLAKMFLDSLELKKYKIYINSIGCQECRRAYKEALRSYYEHHYDHICDDCKRRFETNIMRLLDCKVDINVAKQAPKISDYLCDHCRDHYESIKQMLRDLRIDFHEDSSLVRGLDYYTRTVFEIKHESLGAQSTILAGGRYDGLCKELGGHDIPSLGFASGIERLILAVKAEEIEIPKPPYCDVYIASIGKQARVKAFQIAQGLRLCKIPVISDVNSRSLKAQLKHADKLGAILAIIIGENELAQSTVQVKNLLTEAQSEVEFDYVVDYVLDLLKAEGRKGRGFREGNNT